MLDRPSSLMLLSLMALAMLLALALAGLSSGARQIRRRRNERSTDRHFADVQGLFEPEEADTEWESFVRAH